MQRRSFLQNTLIAGAALAGGTESLEAWRAERAASKNILLTTQPMVISTWDHGMAANEAARKVLSNNGHALDAVEQGVMVPEADPKVTSVGYGGFPDRDGRVTLDACIMDEAGRAGSVACLEHIMHPISVARKVMDKTPHVMLVGDGALQFALENGFAKQDLLTPVSRKAWEDWKKQSGYAPPKTRENHDTIGMLAIDAAGNMCGACTTSGLAWKIHGRVGDSPIIGAGLFVDNEVGAACATGKGESVIRIAGSAIIVELMRAGKTPQQACQIAVQRIISKQPDYKDFQVGFLAINRQGQTGAYALHKGFQYALYKNAVNTLSDSAFATE